MSAEQHDTAPIDGWREELTVDSEVTVALTELAVSLIQRLPRQLSLTALSTLGNVRRGGPQRLTQLAQLEGVARPTMTAVVSRLEEEGLVTRSAEPSDRRVALVAITSAGERLLADRQALGTELLAERIRELPAGDIARLREALAALRALAGGEPAPRGRLVALRGAAGDRRPEGPGSADGAEPGGSDPVDHVGARGPRSPRRPRR